MTDPALDPVTAVAPPTQGTRDLASLLAAGCRFGTVYADPPWRYRNTRARGAAERHYPTMAVQEIAALPVRELAARDAHLWLWATNAFLFEAPKVFEAWGFEYKSVFVWCKPQMGLGNYWRVSHELLLLGVRGGCPVRRRNLRSWGIFARGPHSQKPEPVRRMVERASPGPRLELFARKVAPGWVAWGNEVPVIEVDSMGKSIRLGSRTFRVLFPDLLRPLNAAEREGLMKDIAGRGVVAPVIVDARDGVIDGLNRLELAAELGIDVADIPFRVMDLTRLEEKRALALALNEHRRHLTAEELQELRRQRVQRVAEARRNGQSYRAIADQENVSESQVRQDVAAATAQGCAVDPAGGTVTGRDGKRRPAYRDRNGGGPPAVSREPAPGKNPDEPEVLGTPGFDLCTEAGRLYQLLCRRRDGWPEKARPQFLSVLRGIVEQLDAEEKAARGAAADPNPAPLGAEWEKCRAQVEANEATCREAEAGTLAGEALA
jgi:N6-adenosine-specific RNA methylase IME4